MNTKSLLPFFITAALLLAGTGQGRPFQSSPAPAPSPSGSQQSPQPQVAENEKADLSAAAQESANAGPLDFIRAFEKFLKKHPNSDLKDRIVSALFKASKDVKDDRRIVLYGEQLLAKEPNDISVLPFVCLSLNTLNDAKASATALELGLRLETQLNALNIAKDGETPREKSRRESDFVKHVTGAMVIQADAFGIMGRTTEAVATAQKAFDELPSAEAGRSLGCWQSKAGNFDAAVTAYADAFALPDSPENHIDDRTRMAELYRKRHKDEKGLGDIVLAAYDRMTAINAQRQRLLTNTLTTKPIDFELTSLAGGHLPLLSLKGKVIVMDFWATTCGPCRTQHPLFEQVKKAFQADNRVVFLEIDNEEPRDIVQAFVQKQAWDGNVYFDDGLGRALAVQAIPTTVLLNRDGEVYSKMMGFRPESFVATLTAKIQDVLSSGGKVPPISNQVN